MISKSSDTPGKDPVISVRNLVYRYQKEDRYPVLNGIDLEIFRGDYLVVAGRSGSGKSTLCRTFNGLIPHFHRGVLEGDVQVAGHAVNRTAIADLFSHVGMVFQNPDTQLFCRSVEQEIVFGLESLGLSRKLIKARLRDSVEQTGIGGVIHRDPQTLSGGEKYLVLITALIALRPQLLVLDEPFANLDPANVRRVRKLLKAINAEGISIVICEHRLSRAVPDATRLVVLDRGRVVADGMPQEVLARAPEQWGLEAPLAFRVATVMGIPPDCRSIAEVGDLPPDPGLIRRLDPAAPITTVDRRAAPLLEVDGVCSRIDGQSLLQNICFSVHPGECVAVVGANGAGKTTLLRHLLGLQRPTEGVVRILGRDIRQTPVNVLAREVGLAFQNPDNQFFKPTVDAEVRVGPEALGVLDPGWIDELMEIFHLHAFRANTPFRLSDGEKKRVAFAAALASRPAILALDEPTAGQDFIFRRNLRELLARLQAGGQAIIIVTHDLSFAERTAPRWLLMAAGRLLADDTPERIMADPDRMARAGLRPTDRFELMRIWPPPGESHA